MSDYVPEISGAVYEPERVDRSSGFTQSAGILVATKSGSRAELTAFEGWERFPGKEIRESAGDHPVWKRIKEPIFWFNRLIAAHGYEGKGDGSLIMEKLAELLDEHGITVINVVNPYGALGLKRLTKFYAKFGFVQIAPGLMVREPRPVSK